MGAAGIKHRAPQLVGLRLAQGRELVPRVASELARMRAVTRSFGPGVAGWGAVVASGAGISRRRKTLDAETGVRPTGCPREAPRWLLRQLFMLEELMA